MEQSSVWIIGIVALAIGALIGYLIGRANSDNGQQKELMEQLEETQQELNGYKAQVDNHFIRTAELVNNLTESYKEVHEHLANSAQTLCKDSVGAQRLEASSLQPRLTESASPAAEAVEVKPVKPAASNVEPPRDYAPKKADDEGTLSETFGLKEEAQPVPQGPADISEEHKAEKAKETTAA